MEPEGSLPHSQQPATCPCPEPDPSSPRTPSHFSTTHFNIILSFVPGSSKWSPSLRFPHQSPVCTSPLIHTCYMPCPSQSEKVVSYKIQNKTRVLCIPPINFYPAFNRLATFDYRSLHVSSWNRSNSEQACFLSFDIPNQAHKTCWVECRSLAFREAIIKTEV